MSGEAYFLGIDSGSTMCKTVLFDGEAIIDTMITKTGWDPLQSAKQSLNAILERNALSLCDVRVAATGYGREAIGFAGNTYTEITCHAFGGAYFYPEAQGIIDIGGQDSKVIMLKNNKVADFLMNDKCAAGTGRFLSMACDALGISLEKIDGFTHPSESIPVNSMCTVFAESEIISLLSMQQDRSRIMSGVLDSIAQKILQMAGKIGFQAGEPILMTGGLSKSSAVIRAISKATGLNVMTHPYAEYAGAVGACLCSIQKKAARVQQATANA